LLPGKVGATTRGPRSTGRSALPMPARSCTGSIPHNFRRRPLVDLREAGATLRQAAALAGLHVATVCRWQQRDPDLRLALRAAADEARRVYSGSYEPRPRVRWRRDCPLCKAKVVVRTAGPGLRFWRCGRWPLCPWASWRSRAPRNCRRCGGPCFWSHSRMSSAYSGCGMRTRAP